MAQRLRDLGLDFSGFSRAAGRTLEAAQIRAQADANLGGAIERGLGAVAGGITRKKAQDREDSLRAEDKAERLRLEGRADARYAEERDYRRAQDQIDLDRKNLDVVEMRIRDLASEAEAARVVEDSGRVAALLPQIEQYRALQAKLVNRVTGGNVSYSPMPAPPPPPTLGRPPAGASAAPATRGGAESPMDRAAWDAAQDPALFGAPPQEDPLVQGMRRIQTARGELERLNRLAGDAIKRGDSRSASALYDRATQVRARLGAEEGSLEASKRKMEEDRAARAAAARLAEKQADRATTRADKTADTMAEANRRANEYRRVTGQAWDGEMDPDIIRDAILFHKQRSMASDAASRTDARRAEEEKRGAAKEEKADARRAASREEKIGEQEINDAESDLRSAEDDLRAMLSRVVPDRAGEAAARERIASLRRLVEDLRRRRRGGASPAAPAAPTPSPAPAADRDGSQSIREWLEGK